MNKYIAYYSECTFEGSFEYIVPFISNLSIKEIENKLIDISETTCDVNRFIVGLPSYIKQQEVLQVEIYTLEDWFDRNKVIVE